MELGDHEIDRFIRAWKKDFGETLSEDDARAELSRLLTFLYALYDSTNGPDRPGGNNLPECDTMAA